MTQTSKQRCGTFLRCLGAVAGLALASGASQASIVYTYTSGAFGFTYTSPALYPEVVDANDLDRCEFGADITCVSVDIYDNYFYVRGVDASAPDPNQTRLIFAWGGCPPYFGIGYTASASQCGVTLGAAAYQPFAQGTLTVTQGASVPEPGSLALMASGLLLLALRRRSAHRRAAQP